jgi:hypothetical protein
MFLLSSERARRGALLTWPVAGILLAAGIRAQEAPPAPAPPPPPAPPARIGWHQVSV